MRVSAYTESKCVLIVETACSGHHLVYVRLLVEAALGRGDSVAFATTAAVLSDERFVVHLGDLKDRIRVIRINPTESLKTLQELGSQLGAYAVLVPDALPFGANLLLGQRLNDPELRLLIMNDPRWRLEGSLNPQPRQLAKLFFLSLASKRRGQVIFWLRPPGYTSATESFVCDPVVIESRIDTVQSEAAVLRRRLGMSSQVYWFGLVGGIGDWKNPSMVVRAVATANARTKVRLGLVVIGQWRASEDRAVAEDALREGGVDFVVHEGHLTNSQVNAAVSALDCLVLAYSTTAPNSTAGKAAALGVRVLAAGAPSFRRFAREIAGVHGVPLDHESLVDGMLAATIRPVPMPRLGYGTAEFTDPLLLERGPEAPAVGGVRRDHAMGVVRVNACAAIRRLNRWLFWSARRRS